MTMTQIKLDREQWLTEAAHLILEEKLAPVVNDKHPMPAFRVSVGFTGARTSKAIASCFVRAASKDNVNEIFVTPELDDSLEILGAVTHELIHAYDDCASGHRNFFAAIARGVGLEGKLTATVAGPELAEYLQTLIDLLGPIPHAALQLSKAKKKGGTRMIKVECSACDWSFRTSQKNIDLMSSCTCLACGDNQLSTQNV